MRERERATHTAADIHEADDAYLRECRENARGVAARCGWQRVDCTRDGRMRGIEDIQQQQPLLLLFPQPQLFPQPPQPKRIRMMIRISHTQEQSLLLHIYVSPHLSCSVLSYAGKCKWGPDR